MTDSLAGIFIVMSVAAWALLGVIVLRERWSASRARLRSGSKRGPEG